MVLLQSKLYFSKNSEGSNRGSNVFQGGGGVQLFPGVGSEC